MAENNNNNKEKNIKKTCDCVVTQPQPGHYVEDCKCEFDADFNNHQDKKKCKKCHSGCEVQLQCCCPQQQKPACMQQQQQQQPQQQSPCGMQISPTGCVEDPYAALADCVQKCMNEKGQLAQTCGIKCPDCPPPPADGGAAPADKPAKDKGDKAAKGDKAKGKGKKKGAK